MKTALFFVTLFAAGVSLLGCSNGPPKAEALAVIKREVHRDGVCTLPVDLMAKAKKQHTSKAICTPKDASPQLVACMDALVAAQLASPMPPGFIHDYTDETALAASPYDRRVRDLDFAACFTMSDELREGRFACADVEVDRIAKVTSTSETTADVRYIRTIKPHPSLAAIEKACGATIHPADDDTVAFAKNAATGQWALVPAAPPAP